MQSNNIYDFNNLFNNLDDLDKGIILGVMVDLLRSDKYNKRVAYEQDGNIIIPKFEEGARK